MGRSSWTQTQFEGRAWAWCWSECGPERKRGAGSHHQVRGLSNWVTRCYLERRHRWGGTGQVGGQERGEAVLVQTTLDSDANRPQSRGPEAEEATR